MNSLMLWASSLRIEAASAKFCSEHTLGHDSAALGLEQDAPFNRVTESGLKVYLNNRYSAQQIFLMPKAPSSQSIAPFSSHR